MLPSGLRMQELELGDQGDRPVTQGQTVRISYVARLDDGSECARGEASFRLGNATPVCDALHEGVEGMRVGDVRRLRAPAYMRRGKALDAAPSDDVIEYHVQLTGAVHHMQIVTVSRDTDPLQTLWDFSKRSILSVLGSGSKKKP